ncbi:MAG: alpha/beta hydrolase [Clostridia bacterium]|nr:alpha/beta hydrolase [Clostridia bacterium]
MMIYEFTSFDGKKISVREWNEVSSPKGVIQISHGMAEHSGRYDIFAREMNARGYIVFADDHRAHGLTDKDTLGYSDGDIYSDTLKDLGLLAGTYREKYCLPLFFFGHSYGSFLGQRFIEEYGSLVSAAVLGGSNYMNIFTTKFGKAFASAACVFGRSKKPSGTLKKASFDAYDKKFGKGESFISSLPAERDRYFADPFCAFVCSNAFYKWFFKGILAAYKAENLAKIPADLPVLLIAGASDPVGEMGKGVTKLEELYKKHGVAVKKVLYEGVRHEFLNDVSRAAAFDEIEKFFSANIKG